MASTATEIRRMTADDLTDCLRLGEPVFREYWPLMDAKAMHEACLRSLTDQSVFMVRYRDAFGVAAVESTLFEPRLWVKEQYVFSRSGVWSAIAIYRAMKMWAVQIGAFRFTFGSQTEYDVDVIARYLAVPGERMEISKAFTFEIGR